MRLVADLSAYQSHNSEWTAPLPVVLGAFASVVDAVWVRWTDWKGYVQWGADPYYERWINELRDVHGKPVGAYLFPRPGMGSPAQQVGAWRAATPAITFAPMLDPESNDGLSGPAFSAWVDNALAEMSQRWQMVPWLYASASMVAKFGWSRPSTPHHLILAEYHWSYETFRWADRAGWEAKAYSKYDGPEIPAGWPYQPGRPDAWQFTSSAEVPGMAGLIDCSWMTEEAFRGSLVPLSGVDDGFTPADRERLTRVGARVDQLWQGFGGDARMG